MDRDKMSVYGRTEKNGEGFVISNLARWKYHWMVVVMILAEDL
jgi:hypothetical protein